MGTIHHLVVERGGGHPQRQVVMGKLCKLRRRNGDVLTSFRSAVIKEVIGPLFAYGSLEDISAQQDVYGHFETAVNAGGFMEVYNEYLTEQDRDCLEKWIAWRLAAVYRDLGLDIDENVPEQVRIIVAARKLALLVIPLTSISKLEFPQEIQFSKIDLSLHGHGTVYLPRSI